MKYIAAIFVGVAIGISLLMVFAAEPENVWHATCTDTTGQESAPSEIVRANGCKKNRVTANIPLSRTDGKTLTATELTACTFYLNGKPAKLVPPAPVITYEHPAATTGCAAPIDPKPQPPQPPKPAPTVPYNATATRVANGYRIDCAAPAGTSEVRLLGVNANGSLGARVATSKKGCPFVTPHYSGARQYVLKAVVKGVLSGRSEPVTTK